MHAYKIMVGTVHIVTDRVAFRLIALFERVVVFTAVRLTNEVRNCIFLNAIFKPEVPIF